MVQGGARQRSILIVNPNTTSFMTDGLKPLVKSLGFDTTSHTYFTAPTGVKSINNEEDAAVSAEHCLPHLVPMIKDYEGFLICCYSPHPLVSLLEEQPEVRDHGKIVTGIFEASVATSLQAIHPKESFGIVSTGQVWEEILSEAIGALLGGSSNRFAGVQTTGLNATELHTTSPEEVKRRMKEATKRLLKTGNVGAICLGCAGMAGMDEIVRQACIEQLGEKDGGRVRIVDGVIGGVAWIEGALRSGL